MKTFFKARTRVHDLAQRHNGTTAQRLILLVGLSFVPASLWAQTQVAQVALSGVQSSLLRNNVQQGMLYLKESVTRGLASGMASEMGVCMADIECRVLLAPTTPAETTNPSEMEDFSLSVKKKKSLSRFEEEPPSSIYPSGNKSGQTTLAYVKSEEIESFDDKFKDEDSKMRGLVKQFRRENDLSGQLEYLTPRERQFYREQYEKLRTLAQVKPSPVDRLSAYLRHQVPPETSEYIQHNYSQFTYLSRAAAEELGTWLTYSILPTEGRKLLPQERNQLFKLIEHVRTALRPLLRSMPQNPYLDAQKEYWDTWSYTVFPSGINAPKHREADALRVDGRVYEEHEFFLYNPDKTKHYMPDSRTLIKDDPDEDDDEDSYAAIRARQERLKKQQAALEAEREELLKAIPEGMHIAFINDDSLPILNFQHWAKQGYLGKEARLDAFKNGLDFMDALKRGAHYDLVLTDLEVPFAGSAMMPQLRELAPNMTVLGCSRYEDYYVDGRSSFEEGFDGYMWYTSNLNQGDIGYIEYLRGMKNYFYYRNLHKWQR